MNHFSNKVYTFCLRFVQILLVAFTGTLLISGLLFTGYSTDMETQKVLFQWDNPFVTLVATALFCGILFSVALLFSGLPSRAHRILRMGVLCWVSVIGGILILFGKTVPAADAYSVYSIAQSLAAGDTSVIHPTDSYLSYYPQQIGLTAFWEILIRFWNLLPIDLHAYHFLKIVCVLLSCVIIIFQEKTIDVLWKNQKACCLYLLLAAVNCPLLMYTSFVYGEIPSFAAISVSFYFLARLLVQETGHSAHTLRLALGSLFFLTLSVMLRKNSLIFMLAAVLVLLLTGIRKKRPALFLLTALCLVCTLSILPTIQKYYEYRSGSAISSGVPAVSYFAMGMQESSRADGWYNAFNFDTYQSTGMDTEATTEISLEAIRDRMAYFRQNPAYAAKFYWQKYLSQWADGTYACRQATLATFGGRASFFVSLYEGDYSKYIIAYCNIYQNVLYLGVFVFCLFGLLRKSPGRSTDEPPAAYELPAYLGLIGALGGFLFHMIWEANSRYIFLYGLALLPYAARGLWQLEAILNSTLRRRKST